MVRFIYTVNTVIKHSIIGKQNIGIPHQANNTNQTMLFSVHFNLA